MSELRSRSHMSSWALQFTILTGLRTGAVIGARWPEFSLDAEVPKWVVPKERIKTKIEFDVPLSKQAVQLLRTLPHLDGSDVVFWGQPTRKERPGKPKGSIGPLSNMAMLELLQGMREEMTVHGFRSSFRDWAAETTSYSSEVVEMALAHSINDDVEAAYRRGDLFARRVPLMQDWADYLDGAQSQENGECAE
jgi:integrase